MAQCLYDYLPSLFSIFLILISGRLSGYLEFLVNGISSGMLSGDPGTRSKQRELIKWTAMDWATRVGFIGSALAASVSWFVLFSSAPDPSLGLLEIITGALLLVAFVVGLFLILSTPSPYLVALTHTQLFKLTIPRSPARFLDYALVGVNALLILGILFKQVTSP